MLHSTIRPCSCSFGLFRSVFASKDFKCAFGAPERIEMEERIAKYPTTNALNTEPSRAGGGSRRKKTSPGNKVRVHLKVNETGIVSIPCMCFAHD